MKTQFILKSITAFVIMILAANFSMAGIHNPEAADALKKVMKKQLPYPNFAQETFQTGFAVIAFSVDNNGKIILKDINASTPEFRNYVEEKIKDIKLEKPELYQGETQYYRFDFKLINEK